MIRTSLLKKEVFYKIFKFTVVFVTLLFSFAGCMRANNNFSDSYEIIIQYYKKSGDMVINTLSSLYIQKINNAKDKKEKDNLYEEYKRLIYLYDGMAGEARTRLSKIVAKLNKDGNSPDNLPAHIDAYFEANGEIFSAINEILLCHNEDEIRIDLKRSLLVCVLSAYKVNTEGLKDYICRTQMCETDDCINNALSLIEKALITADKAIDIAKNESYGIDKNTDLCEKANLLSEINHEIESALCDYSDNIKFKCGTEQINATESNFVNDFLNRHLAGLIKKLEDVKITEAEIETEIDKCFSVIDKEIEKLEKETYNSSPEPAKEAEKRSIAARQIATEANKINLALRILDKDEKVSEIQSCVGEVIASFSNISTLQNKIKSLQDKTSKILGIYLNEYNKINDYLTTGEYKDKNGKTVFDKAPLDVILGFKSEIVRKAYAYSESEYNEIISETENALIKLKYSKSIDEAKGIVVEFEKYINSRETLYDKAFKAYLEAKSTLSKVKTDALKEAISACEARATALGLERDFVYSELNGYTREGKVYRIYDEFIKNEKLCYIIESPKKAEVMKALNAVPNTPVTLTTHTEAMELLIIKYSDLLGEFTLTFDEQALIFGTDNATKLNNLLARYKQLKEAKEAAKDIINTISNFKGKVTLLREAEIISARNAVNGWIEKYKIGQDSEVYKENLALITNLNDLADAENRLITLKNAKEAANSVIAAINAIGEVVPNSYGESKIIYAERLFGEWIENFEIDKDESVKHVNRSIVTNINTLSEARNRYNLLMTEGKNEADGIKTEIISVFLPNSKGGYDGLNIESETQINGFIKKITEWIKKYAKDSTFNPAYILIEEASILISDIQNEYLELKGGIDFAYTKITSAAMDIRTDVMSGKTSGILYDILAIERGEAAIINFERNYYKLTELHNAPLEDVEKEKLLYAANVIRRAREVYNEVYFASKRDVHLFYDGLNFLETNVGSFQNIKLIKTHLESIQKAYFDWLLTYFPRFFEKKYTGEIIGYGDAKIDPSYPKMSDISSLLKYIAYEGEYGPKKLLNFINDAFANFEYGLSKIQNDFTSYKNSGSFLNKWELISELNYLKKQWEIKYLGGEIGKDISEWEIADFDTIKLDSSLFVILIASIKDTGRNASGQIDQANGYNGGDYLFKKIQKEYNAVRLEIEGIYNLVYAFEQNYYKKAGQVSIYSIAPQGYDLPDFGDIPKLTEIRTKLYELKNEIGYVDKIKSGKKDASLNEKIAFINNIPTWQINLDNMINKADTLKSQKQSESNALLQRLMNVTKNTSKSELEDLMCLYNMWLNGENAPSGTEKSSYRIIFVFKDGRMSENQMYYAYEIFTKIKEIESMLSENGIDFVVREIDKLYNNGVTIAIDHYNIKLFDYENPEIVAIESKISELRLDTCEIENYYKLLELKMRYDNLKQRVKEIHAIYFEYVSETLPKAKEAKYALLCNMLNEFCAINGGDDGGLFKDFQL